MAMLVADQLVSQGRLGRSYLGVQLENAFDVFTARQLGLSAATGALVSINLSKFASPAQGYKWRRSD